MKKETVIEELRRVAAALNDLVADGKLTPVSYRALNKEALEALEALVMARTVEESQEMP